MVHHYLEDHPAYQRDGFESRPPSPTPSPTSVPPYDRSWFFNASEWIVRHREQVESVHMKLYGETYRLFGPSNLLISAPDKTSQEGKKCTTKHE